MTKYQISFPSAARVVPEEELRAATEAAHAVVQEAKDAGVWVSGGGIDESIPPVMDDADGSVRAGTYPQTAQFHGSIVVLELPSYEVALEWAAKIAASCRSAQQPPVFQADPADVGDPKEIDVTFDFRSDTPTGKDPDRFSPALRSTHRRLWGRPVPNGALFDLDVSNPNRYLYHESDLGRFFLSSDAIIRTFCRHPRAASIMAHIPEAEQEAFSRQGYTIGGMMIFPGNRVNNKQTINQRRGTHPRIADRFDLTLECIRRHYLRQSSPLADTLELYPEFFGLFGDFRGYVDFFLLQDLVTEDYASVRFFLPFADFTTRAIPKTLDEYLLYRQATLEFVGARNAQIADFVAEPK
ncbi:YciI family protein [Arthrobacter sp. NicSoilC12]|uniref:YciI family protein n=1 Tax=Arthrobacter sp. NicSoilC12 TaxID=2831001 RepID=UPI0035B50A3A